MSRTSPYRIQLDIVTSFLLENGVGLVVLYALPYFPKFLCCSSIHNQGSGLQVRVRQQLQWSLEPPTVACPNRIISDAGTTFAIGAVGGSFYHFAKGLHNAPNGARFAGGLQAMRMNVPRAAGSFAVWCTMYSACDCTLVHLRQKEDPWNSILSGAATSGIFSLRKGFRAVVRSSMQGAILFALISGAGIMMQSSQPDDITPVDTSSGGG